MNYDEALTASQDDDWRQRYEAAEVLGEYTDDSAYTIMLQLLIDWENTGVTLRAAQSLVGRGDLYGATLAFSGLALAIEQSGHHILWEIHSGWYENRFDVELFSEQILAGENSVAKYGVRQYLNWHDIYRPKDEVTLNWYREHRT